MRIYSSFEETFIPFTKGCFVQRLFEIDTVVLEKNIFLSNVFLLFSNFLHLEKGGTLQKLKSPSPKGVFCQVWLKLVQRYWWKRQKFGKFSDKQTNGQTDRRPEKLTLAFSSGELKQWHFNNTFWWFNTYAL